VARRIDGLETLASEIEQEYRLRAVPLAADLSAGGSAASLREELDRRGVAITSLINNAGFGTWGNFVDEDAERAVEEIALEVTAPVQLAHAFLPSLLATGGGFLINVASMAAYQPTPRMAVYGAAKAFVLSFTESLWAELRNSGLTVFAVSPGATATEFNTVVGTDNATSGARMRTPEDVVATALAHLRKRNPGPSVVDGRANHLASMAARWPSRRAMAAKMLRMTDPERRTKAGNASH